MCLMIKLNYLIVVSYVVWGIVYKIVFILVDVVVFDIFVFR